MSAIDILAPSGRKIEFCKVFIFPRTLPGGMDEGVRNHLEFATDEIRMSLLGEYNLPAELKHRGVFGYVAFGFGGNPTVDPETEFASWQEGAFINWCGNYFRSPDLVVTDNVRIWLRKGVRAQIIIGYKDPASCVGIIRNGVP
jgi:hypothetical protein